MLPVVLFLCCAQVPPSPQPTYADIARVTLRTVYESPRHPGRTQHGSATVVYTHASKTYALTCYHVCHDEGDTSGRLFLARPDGSRLPAKLLASDAKADLAVVEVAAPARAVATVATEEPYQPGTPVVKAGYPQAGPLSLRRGHLRQETNSHPADPKVLYTLATVATLSGDSGGGLFRESDGALIGVHWGSLPDGLRASRLPQIHAVLAQAGLAPWKTAASGRADAPASKLPTSNPQTSNIPVKDADAPTPPPSAKPQVFADVAGGSRDVTNVVRALQAGKRYKITVEELPASSGSKR